MPDSAYARSASVNTRRANRLGCRSSIAAIRATSTASMPCPMIAMPGAPVGRAPPRAGRAHDGYFDAVFAGLASLFEAFDFVSVVFAGLASVFLDESPELSVEGDAAFLSASAFFL